MLKKAINVALYLVVFYTWAQANFFPDTSDRWKDEVGVLTMGKCLKYKNMRCHKIYVLNANIFVFLYVSISLPSIYGAYCNYRKRKGKEYQWRQFDDDDEK